jgi:hypothetical protein
MKDKRVVRGGIGKCETMSHSDFTFCLALGYNCILITLCFLWQPHPCGPSLFVADDRSGDWNSLLWETARESSYELLLFLHPAFFGQLIGWFCVAFHKGDNCSLLGYVVAATHNERSPTWFMGSDSIPDREICPPGFRPGRGTSLLLHNNLRTFAFAGAKDDGLVRSGLVGRGAAAMSIAMEVELALAKFGPQQSGSGRGHNHQGNYCLPIRIHDFNISGDDLVAICFSIQW